MKRQSYIWIPFAAASLCAGCAALGGEADAHPVAPPSRASAVGFVSEAQVARGRATFELSCGECHTTSQLSGDDFDWTWRRQTAWQLFKSVSATMPEDDPGGLSRDAYVDVVAFVLSLNGYASGGVDLVVSEASLSEIALGRGAPRRRK